MVPLNEMTDTLRIVKKTSQLLQTDDFVRLTRTMYKGDLAQVDWIDVTEKQACLRLLPRIEYKRKKYKTRPKNVSFLQLVFIITLSTYFQAMADILLPGSEDEEEVEMDEELDKFKEAQSKRTTKENPAEPFDFKRMNEAGVVTSIDGDFIRCQGQRYRHGLLYKVFSLDAFVSFLSLHSLIFALF